MATADTTDKGIEYYLEHPEEVDVTDTALMQRLEAAVLATESDTSGSADKSVATTTKDDEGKSAAKTDSAGKTGEDAKTSKVEGKDESLEASAGGILTADGKHVIPMEVLERAREEGAAAQQALRETTEIVLRLQNRVRELEGGGRAAPADESAVAGLEAKLEEVRENAPWLVETVEALIKQTRALEARVEVLTERDADEDAAYVQSMQRDSTAAINANAALTLWKSTAPQLYAEAGRVDKYLRTDPEEAKRYARADGSIDFARRFDDAVEIVKTRHRNDEQPIPLPKPIAGKGADAGKSPDPDPEKTRQAARAALAKADTGVTTISDLPGGHAPAQSEEESAENMSVTQLAQKFGSMSPEKLDAFLSRYN